MLRSKTTPPLILACIAFLFLGLTLAAIGPLLPGLAKNANTDLAAIGSIFTALYLGALISQLAAGPITDHIGQRPVLVVGLLLLAVGLVGLTLTRSLISTLALTFLAGLGHGAIDLSSHILLSRVFQDRNVGPLNLLNFFFGVGAILGPAAVSLGIMLTQNGMVVMWAAAAGLLILAPQVLLLKNLPQVQHKTTTAAASGSVYISPFIWIFGLFLLTYVGIENGMGGWVSNHITRTTLLGLQPAALVASGFWLALTAGRFVSAVFGSKQQPSRILLLSLVGILAGSLLYLVGLGNPLLTITAVLVTGFFYGPVYPVAMAIVTNLYRVNTGKATSVVAAMGSMGGMIIPWLQGLSIATIGPVASGWFAVGGGILMLFLFATSLASIKKTRSNPMT